MELAGADLSGPAARAVPAALHGGGVSDAGVHELGVAALGAATPGDGWLANEKHFAGVAVVPVFYHGDVDIQRVSGFQFLAV